MAEEDSAGDLSIVGVHVYGNRAATTSDFMNGTRTSINWHIPRHVLIAPCAKPGI
jgi:hypothetical protein